MASTLILQDTVPFDAVDLNGTVVSTERYSHMLVWFSASAYDGLATPEVSPDDGGTWFNISWAASDNLFSFTNNTDTFDDIYIASIPSDCLFRVRMSGGATGTLDVFAQGSQRQRRSGIIISLDNLIKGIFGYRASWPLQELSGAVSLADNVAVLLGRNTALKTFADYDIAEAGWSHLGGEVAHCDGSQAGNSFLLQPGVYAPSVPGITGEITFTISNYFAGNAQAYFQGGIGPLRGGNGTFIEPLTTTTALRSGVRADVNFIGDIDLKIVTFKQTGILDDDEFPGSETLDESGASGTATAANFTPISDPVLSNPNVGELRVAILGADNTGIAEQDSLTIGVRYIARGEARTNGSNGARARIFHNLVGVELWRGTTETTDWEEFEFEFTAIDTDFNPTILSDGTGDTYSEFRNVSVTEHNPLNGDDTGTTPAEFTEAKMVLKGYDGTAFTDLTNATHNSVLDPATFAKGAFFIRPTWDTTERWLFIDWVDANNYMGIRFTTVAGQIAFDYKAEGQALVTILYATGSPTRLSHAAIQVESNVLQAFFDGIQVGSDTAVAITILGNFTFQGVAAKNAVPQGGFDGGVAYPVEYANAIAQSDWLSIYQGGTS